MFKDTILLFDFYCESYDSRDGELNQHLAAEVKERLMQLDFINAKVRELEALDCAQQRELQLALGRQASKMIAAGVTGEIPVLPELNHKIEGRQKQLSSLAVELRLFTEAFYFAARIRTILRDGALPGLKSFDCVSVRNIRNHLIEHPEGKSSLIFSQSLGWGDARGPVLKSGRPPDQGQGFQDAGLHVNAEEFKTNLERALKSYCIAPNKLEPTRGS